MATRVAADARTLDRRKRHPLLADWRWAFRGRRREIRRDSDDGLVQPDHIPPMVVAAVVTVVILSALDAYFTLHLIRAGVVTEANPVMRYFIDTDTQMFINVKTAFTGGALLILVACSNLRVFSRVKVSTILYGVVGLYVALIGYHLSLLNAANLL